MFLHPLLVQLAPAALPALALLWCLAVRLGGQARLLREDDLSDWLLADIGWRDGRDAGARRMAARCALPPRARR